MTEVAGAAPPGAVGARPVGAGPVGSDGSHPPRRTGVLAARSWASRLPLRIALVAMLTGLVALALTLTGLLTSAFLEDYVRDQRRDQIDAALVGYGSAPWFVDRCQDPGRGQGFVTPGTIYVGCLPPGSNRTIPISQPPQLISGPPTVTGADARELVAGTGRPVIVEGRDGTTWLLESRDVGGGVTAVAGVDLDSDDRLLARLVALQVVVGLVVLLLLGSAAYVLVRNSLRPLTEVERTARAIAAGDLSQRVPAGDERTEVGRLSLALNGMLTRIERSFRAQQASEEQARASETRMRRFVADASHELRTPLTSIRGFAELYRQGAVGSPEETARLMQRIESEGARMGVLVEDLLQLARLDQQRPLTITPVDLAEVAGDAVHDARAVQPDRPIALHLDEWLSEVPVVLGDEARLRQVVGNLVTNALVHTPPTAPVTVRVSDEPAPADAPSDGDDGGVVVLQVADGGPGMAPEDAARVFERFYRADPSRARTAGGTGLGLAIVSSLVAAHGGTVHLDTAPGRGAAFTVRLPRSGPGTTVRPVADGPTA
ncbi:HAMP domain-containing sensor histidine kinase [Geodermatophilus sp. DSM 44513]|uniref:sensor histidine kinase n=1 Tax=Geodermatophilus sp. DSM 44513 TaxID=1528104 RepID=UPI001285D331|nr:HAMP domain-containing sensor histidine kinase [Geodermatophilus sp. DSM 44513]WNV75097.1 HAMP domain-containing sensor histidine kinase [Geodermatophilus sp. DSM 44513]